MIGKTILSEFRPYKKAEIPKFDIDYRGLIRYARSVGKSVVDLSDCEKEKFIHGSSMVEIREKSIKVGKDTVKP